MNPYGVPGVTPQELNNMLINKKNFILLDVREPYELDKAKISDTRVKQLPLSLLARDQLKAIPETIQKKDTHIVVMCHHGVRSAQVAAWLLSQGWTNVLNLDGGIDAFAKTIDHSIGLY